MRNSQFFNLTLRIAPGESTSLGNEFLLRAGYIRQVSNGIFASLPLGKRSIQKLEHILRQEFNRLDGQEIDLPSLTSGDFVLDSHFEPEPNQWFDSSQPPSVSYLIDLVKHLVRSHRHLPRLLFHIKPKTLHDTQNRSGFLSARTITRFEGFSLDKDFESATQQYENLHKAFQNLLIRCKLPFKEVEFNKLTTYPYAGNEFFYLHQLGDTNLLHCRSCDYWANQKTAPSFKTEPQPEPLNPLEKVHTPNTKTIEDLSKFLNIPSSRTAKAVFMTASIMENNTIIEKVVMAIVRGDMELDERKLTLAIRARKIRPSTEMEIQSIGAVPGFASPIGLKHGLIVVDEFIPASYNLVAGANLANYHLKNVNYGRDFQAHIIADLTLRKEGDPCPNCGDPLEIQCGFRIGQMIAPDHQLSVAAGCNFQDEKGELKPVIIGSAWIDLERILACVAEEHNDIYGLILPLSISPFQIHLIVLPSNNSDEPLEFADKLYQELQRARIDVLYDDRKESPGTKFNDVDLIGIPLRITVAEKSLSQGQVEFKLRHEKEKTSVLAEEAVAVCMHNLLKLEREIAQAIAKNIILNK
jgi:prolyl-tRNA synthetase